MHAVLYVVEFSSTAAEPVSRAVGSTMDYVMTFCLSLTELLHDSMLSYAQQGVK